MRRVYRGTPVDLKDAIVRGLHEIVGDDVEITREDDIVKRFHDIIQDRISQSFQAAMCERGNTEAIMKLWHSRFPKKRGN